MNEPGRGYSKKIVVADPLGLHARPSAAIAKLSGGAVAGVWLEKEGERADASSMIDIMSLACMQGTEITLTIDSAEDGHVFNAIVEFISRGA